MAVEALELRRTVLPETSDLPFAHGQIRHFYQPFRWMRLLSDPNPDARARIEPGEEVLRGHPDINERIFQECYYPMMVESPSKGPDSSKLFPLGTYSSFYSSLRAWMKFAHPKEFDLIKQNINARGDDKRYVIMADPFLHLIMPDETPENQKMWFEIGFKSFKRDLNFYSAGVWLPELAVGDSTMQVLGQLKNTYDLEYLVLEDNQITNNGNNPVFYPIRNSNGDKIDELAIVHFDSKLSGRYSYEDPYTENADTFLETAKWERLMQRWGAGMDLSSKEAILVASDGELYGHHKRLREFFAEFIMRKTTLERHGFEPFDLAKALKRGDRVETEVIGPSSWSCPHGIDRWKGLCGCGVANEVDKSKKIELYQRTKLVERQILKSLKGSGISDWRARFTVIVLETIPEVYFEGDVYDRLDKLSRESGLEFLSDNRKRDLILAFYALELGKKSCRMFFDGVNGVERQLGWLNVAEAETLLARAT